MGWDDNVEDAKDDAEGQVRERFGLGSDSEQADPEGASEQGSTSFDESTRFDESSSLDEGSGYDEDYEQGEDLFSQD
jgi:uncharacterized protein YjbJ (UPF0337 family)